MNQASSSSDEERLMTLSELAKYLSLGEKTVLKLATRQNLPGIQVNKQWRFRRQAVEEWIESLGGTAPEDPEDVNVPLGDLLPVEAIISDLRAKKALQAIQELAARAYSNHWINDKDWFINAIVQREALASTAMEGGVALMHTRARDKSKIERPFIIAGRSYSGIDLGASDGKPSYLLFLLGLKFDQLHLPILARLARILRNPAVVSRLRAISAPNEIRALLLKEDADAIALDRSTPVKYELVAPKLDRKSRLRAIMRVDAIRKHSEKKAMEAEKKAAIAREKKAARKQVNQKATGQGKVSRAATKKSSSTKKAAVKKVSAAKKTLSTQKRTATKKAPTKAAKKSSTTKKAPAQNKTATTAKASAKKVATKRQSATAKPKKASTKKTTASTRSKKR